MQNEHRFTRAIDADVHTDDQTKLISQPYIQPIFQCTHDYLQLNLYLKKTPSQPIFKNFFSVLLSLTGCLRLSRGQL